MSGHIYNIPASCSFVDVLAEKFGREYQNSPEELAKILFLLPNRRACKALQDAFVRFNGLRPAILPRIVPIGDADEDALFFSVENSDELLSTLPPVIDNYERLFLFARLIISKPKEYGLPEMTYGQALSLAHDLGQLIDTSYNEQLSFDRLAELVPDQYSSHWQEILKFLRIITEYWPQILQERGLCDLSQRKNILLKAQGNLWLKNPPQYKIVAAGTVSAFPQLRELLKVIYQLDNGEIYLYGVDKYLEDNAWDILDESHPQFETQQLLECLQIKRSDIADLVTSVNLPREIFASEIMRPAQSTIRWRNLERNPLPKSTYNGLSVINCRDKREEAAAIALIMRESLNTPEKTTALVTTDRGLARRVASELERWDIKIDDSAGKPLHLTPIGIFLRQIPETMERGLADSALLALAKSPFVRLGEDNQTLRRQVRRWEVCKRTPMFDDKKPDIPEEVSEWLVKIKNAINPLVQIYDKNKAPFKDFMTAHLMVAENLAVSTENSGADNLWRGDDGRAAADLFSQLLPQAEQIGEISPFEYGSVLLTLLSQKNVRATYGTHPRLKILGPIEARFNHYDTVIIGGMNEGVWPPLPSSDPWMSRPMKRDFGMPLPERAIGIMASDFCQLLCASEVYLTRSERADGTPMNKSRWLLRLETVLKACGLKVEEIVSERYVRWAIKQDIPLQSFKIEAPKPCPEIKYRPRRLSASAIETLMRNPYDIYARRILKLKPLDDLDKQLSPSDYGNIVHKILEEFNTLYPTQLPDNAKDEFLRIGRENFSGQEITAEVKAFWWPRFVKTVDWLLTVEENYRLPIKQVYSEVKGCMSWEAPAGQFTIEARADRIDVTCDGTINILDYKTGQTRTPKEVMAGYAPQLPIEGLLARTGCFEKDNKKIPPLPIEKLIYWKLGEKCTEYDKNVDHLLEQTLEHLKELIAVFDFATTPYLARPNPRHLPKYSDYEHLARVKEWSTGGDGND